MSYLLVAMNLALAALIIFGFGYCGQYPSLWLILGAFIYRLARWHGMGNGLPRRDLAWIDVAVMGGLLAMTGAYAMACRGIAPSGVVAGIALSIMYVRAFREIPARPGVFAWATLALTWGLIVWRATHTLSIWYAA